jgi:hypothetical protein
MRMKKELIERLVARMLFHIHTSGLVQFTGTTSEEYEKAIRKCRKYMVEEIVKAIGLKE